jgi:hypothetical protein
MTVNGLYQALDALIVHGLGERPILVEDPTRPPGQFGEVLRVRAAVCVVLIEVDFEEKP